MSPGHSPTIHKSFVFGDTLREQLTYLPREERLRFLEAIITYGLDGIESCFDGKDMAIWSGMKALLESLNKKHWASQLNGRLGGAPQENTNARGNRGGGALAGNQNAAKYLQQEGKAGDDSNPKKTNSTYDNLKPPTGYSDSDSDRNLGIGNSDNDYNAGLSTDKAGGVDNSPSSFELIKLKSKDLGYFLDAELIKQITQSGIPSDWFTEPYSVLELANIRVCENEKYGNKPESEKRLLFKNALCQWEGLREEYPEWRAKKEKAAAEKERRKKIELLRHTPPKTCTCGGALDESLECVDCKKRAWFEEKAGIWEFQEPIDFSLAERFRRTQESKAVGG
jgi:hypothetical protein